MTGSRGHGGIEAEKAFWVTFRWDRGAVPVGRTRQLGQAQGSPASKTAFQRFSLQARQPTGEMRYISTSGQPVFDDKGTLPRLSRHREDVDPRAGAPNSLLALEHAVSRRLAEADNTAAALKAVIRRRMRNRGLGVRAVFRVDEKAGCCVLQRGGACCLARRSSASSAGRAPSLMRRAPGWLGLAWQSGQPVWSSDMCPRPARGAGKLARDNRDARCIRLSGDVWGEVVGCSLSIAAQVRDPDERLLDAIRVIGSQIGSSSSENRPKMWCEKTRSASAA